MKVFYEVNQHLKNYPYSYNDGIFESVNHLGEINLKCNLFKNDSSFYVEDGKVLFQNMQAVKKKGSMEANVLYYTDTFKTVLSEYRQLTANLFEEINNDSSLITIECNLPIVDLLDIKRTNNFVFIEVVNNDILIKENRMDINVDNPFFIIDTKIIKLKTKVKNKFSVNKLHYNDTYLYIEYANDEYHIMYKFNGKFIL
jgi:hypothetical protein